MAALRQRAEDYAPGDTDLAWTRTTAWRSLLAGAMDTANAPVVSVSVTAAEGDPVAELLRGWLRNRLGVDPPRPSAAGWFGRSPSAWPTAMRSPLNAATRSPYSIAPACRSGWFRWSPRAG